MTVQGRESKNKACRGITAFTGRIPGVGKAGREIEAPIALVGLVDGQLPAAEVGANFERVYALVQVRLSNSWNVFSRR